MKATAVPIKIKITTTTSAPGKLFFAGAKPDAISGTVEVGRSLFFVPVMTNFWSSDDGACGAVIFWKHVGHSITVPACDESHIMCWPHTGQAYLYSLMDLMFPAHNISHFPTGNVVFMKMPQSPA